MIEKKVAWNKGLTKENDPRVRKYSRPRSEETKRKIGETNKKYKDKYSSLYKGKKRSPEIKEKISKSKLGHQVSDETKNKISKSKIGKKLNSDNLRIKLSKDYIIRKKNNSFNSSKSETELYSKLLEENKNKTIYRNYKCSRYPYYCDFYIVEDDLFIELNAHWTHGGKPFDKNDPSCIEQLELWKIKAEKSQFYKNAINTWTVRDIEKAKCAKENNLNYLVIY